jgi:cysteine-rich repeat protein
VTRRRLIRTALSVVVGVTSLCAAGAARGATVTIVPKGGFTDSTPTAPVGGNSGTTVGQQRLIAVQYVANIWAAHLISSVEIRVAVTFTALSCSTTQGVLGSSGATAFVRDFTGAPLPGTLYPIALANALAGTDQCPPNSDCTAAGFDSDDIDAEFQSAIGSPTCLPSTSWYYGLDGNPGSKQFDFVTVALHELAHGLGFVTLVSPSTGAKAGGADDTFMLNLEDHSTHKLWPAMSDTERAISSVDTGDLHWVGNNVIAQGASLVGGRDASSGHVEMYAPNPVELGSSVSHFSTSLSPDELMEPFIVGPNHDVNLTVALFKDIGWDAPKCGNGIVDPGEECDDGNTDPTDGCTNSCTICGNGVVTAPEQCDDGNLTNGDGCESRCVLTGALPAPDYSPPAAGKSDTASVNCAKAVGIEARKFLTKKYALMRKCVDAVQEYKARAVAGLGADQVQAAFAAAQKACVEPGVAVPDDRTMLGQIAAARRKAISAIEKKCAAPFTTTIDGKPIGSTASNDFSSAAIAAHIDRVGCEVESLIAGGYNGAPTDLAVFTTRASQGGTPLDQQFACLSPPNLPAVDYTTLDGKKDTASVSCQKAVGATVQQALSTEYSVVSKCLNAVEQYNARVAAGLSASQIQSALAAAGKACVEPSATASDGKTMVGKLAAAETKAAGDIEQRCGVPGGSTLDGRPISNSASGDLTRSDIQAHVSSVSCSVERALGLGYFNAASDLSHFTARASQGGESLDQLLPCIAP